MVTKLDHGKKYSAVIKLGMVEQFATNEMIAQKLREAGFTNVDVRGTGSERNASGVWTKETQTITDLPKQITSIQEL